jgi:hypothetical protein
LWAVPQEQVQDIKVPQVHKAQGVHKALQVQLDSQDHKDLLVQLVQVPQV